MTDSLTLLGYLARFGSFTAQSEVLCTQGLAYLLDKHHDARVALAAEVQVRAGVSCDPTLKWIPELEQADGGRPDLEAQTADEIPVVKIEAKLGAQLMPAQLLSYKQDLLDRNNGQSTLLVLVPRGRAKEAAQTASLTFGLAGAGPWPPTTDRRIGIAVIIWDDLFSVLSSGTNNRLGDEVEQLREMYHVLSGDYIAPLAGIEEVREWRSRQADFVNLVDKTTRELTKQPRLLPWRVEPMDPGEVPDDAPEDWLQLGYQMRYVAVEAGNEAYYYSVGVRDPFNGWDTPVWMRFHKDTRNFSFIRRRIEASNLKPVDSSGHIWIPLDAPLKVAGEKIVEALVAQAEEVVRVVWPEMSSMPGSDA